MLKRELEQVEEDCMNAHNAILLRRRRIGEYPTLIAELRGKGGSLGKAQQMGRVGAPRINRHSMQLHSQNLQRQLEKTLIQQEDTIGENTTLRQGIDDLRRERLVFEAAFRSLGIELENKKREIHLAEDLADEHYLARDVAQQRMHDLSLAQAEAKEDVANEWEKVRKINVIVLSP